jgi:hypothetical protein
LLAGIVGMLVAERYTRTRTALSSPSG